MIDNNFFPALKERLTDYGDVQGVQGIDLGLNTWAWMEVYIDGDYMAWWLVNVHFANESDHLFVCANHTSWHVKWRCKPHDFDDYQGFAPIREFMDWVEGNWKEDSLHVG